MNFQMAYFFMNFIKKNDAKLKLSSKFGESNWNPCWLIMLTSASGTNYVINEHEDVDQYVYSTSQNIFAVGRLSAADRSEPLIPACRLLSVTAASGRVW